MSESPANTCDLCKHWHRVASGRLGQCDRWHGGMGSGGYSLNLDEVADNEVLVETDEGWGAMIGPKFGCVLWEPREAAFEAIGVGLAKALEGRI